MHYLYSFNAIGTIMNSLEKLFGFKINSVMGQKREYNSYKINSSAQLSNNEIRKAFVANERKKKTISAEDL